MQQEIKSRNWPYLFWVLFYFLIFWLLFGANVTSFLIVLGIYLVTTAFAFSTVAEKLWRNLCGVRPLRLKQEKNRLYPLFREVYLGAVKINPDLSKEINLYIQEDMDINAFAFGGSTLVITRGSLELLNDDCLKGLMAHELGHFSNHDTVTSLTATISNFFMSLIIKILSNIVKRTENSNILAKIILLPFYVIYAVFRGVDYIGELILRHLDRQHEYMADGFAQRCGFGTELAGVLIEIYHASIHKPQSIKEQLRATHPEITLRIENLENEVY